MVLNKESQLMARSPVSGSVSSSARSQRHADRFACCEGIRASLTLCTSFLGLCVYEKELKKMVFSKVTVDGDGNNHCHRVVADIDADQFSPEWNSTLGHSLGQQPCQVESLEFEIEQRYRGQIADAFDKIASGNIDSARQSLLALMLDPSLPAAVILELAAALSKVDLARFSLTLCERFSESHQDAAELAHDLAIYSVMCRKPPYFSEMNLLKACELEPENARYRLALITWLLANQRISEAVMYSAVPQQLDWSMEVCGCCLAWAADRFKQSGNIALAKSWNSGNPQCTDISDCACCKNFRGFGDTGRAR
jgi:hypothetical protein